MGLRFILGRAGTGKTYTCLREIEQALRETPDGLPMILLVPEQATFQADYALIGLQGLEGFARLQVLSFRRLARQVFLQAGGAARPHIGELGKQMVLRALLHKRREELVIFGRAAQKPGFTGRLAGALTELRLYGIQAPDLERQAAALQRAGTAGTELAGKLHDFAMLYQDMESHLQGRYVDPDDYLALLAEKLRDVPLMAGATVWVDGFAGFTPQEFRVLGELMRQTRRIHVSLCLDPREAASPPHESDLFHPTLETYHQLVELAANNGVVVEEARQLIPEVSPRFGQGSLACLEARFFQRSGRPYVGNAREVCLVEAANRWAEVEAMAREMIRLCRDRGYRWREVAVVLRDIEAYHETISAIFAEYGIPCFIDRKRPVMHHPLVQLMQAALEVVASGWAYEPVFGFLKTDLAPLSRAEVDELENYVLEHGIRGEQWMDEKPWVAHRAFVMEVDREPVPAEQARLARVHRARMAATGAMGRFYRELRPAARGNRLNVRRMTTALMSLLLELGVPATLERWCREAEERGDLGAVREHSQVWDGMMALMDQIVSALGDEAMEVTEYAQVLAAGLDSLRLGLIPPGLDQVLVGSVERSRNPDLRAAFIPGLNEGVFPARIAGEEIFSDSERDELRSRGICLAPSGRVRQFHEQFLTYTALTRASEYLWCGYPLADPEGKALSPSPVVERLRELLPGLTGKYAGVEPAGEPDPDLFSDLEFVVDRRKTLSYLTGLARRVERGASLPAMWAHVYQWFVREEDRRTMVSRVFQVLNHSNREALLPEVVVRQLYGGFLTASVSRLESFAACPFRHFATYGLGLKPRPLYQVAALDVGMFFHAALKLFAERLNERSLDWGSMDDDVCQELVGEVVADLAPRLQGEILLTTARYRYMVVTLRRILERAVHILSEHARRSRFRPVAVELEFGFPGGEVPALQVELRPGWRMELRGRIDRVDTALVEDRWYMRVIDYKSGMPDLRVQDVYHGLALQLPVYLAVARQFATGRAEAPSIPAGVLYFSVRDPLINSAGPLPDEELAGQIRKQLRMRGLVLGEPEAVELMHAGLSGHSDLIPVMWKKDGTPGKGPGSRTVTRDQFGLLQEFVRYRLRELGLGIIRGEVGVAPFRQGTRTACTYCDLRPACQFDSLVEGNGYRFLRTAPEENWWHQMAAAVKGEDADG